MKLKNTALIALTIFAFSEVTSIVSEISQSKPLKADEIGESQTSDSNSQVLPGNTVDSTDPVVEETFPTIEQSTTETSIEVETETTDSSEVPEESSTSEESAESTTETSIEVETETTDSSEVTTDSSQENSESTTESSTTPSKDPETSESKPATSKPDKESKPAKKPVDTSKPKEEVKPSDNRVVVERPTSNAIIDLGEATKDFTTSNLLNYRLPLLSELKSDEEAVLIYGGLLLVGKDRFEEETTKDKKNKEQKVDPITSKGLMTWLGKKYFNQDLLSDNAKKITDKETIKIGDVVVWTNYLDQTQYGLYIGDDILITVENVGDDQYEVVTQYYIENDDQTIYRNGSLALNKEGQSLLKQYPASMNFQTNPLTKKFIELIGEGARELGLKYDVFASVMIAQALLESASGTSGLAQAPNHNLFGIKGQYKNQSVSMSTSEDDGKGNLYTIQSAFRKYPSYQESLKDYVSLIKNGTAWKDDFYKETWRSEANNYITAAQSLTGKYATDTQYDKKIVSLIAAYDLTQYDEPKLDTTVAGKTSGILTSRAAIPKEYRELMKFPDYNQKNYNTSGSYPVGQCTWYAYNRVAQLGMVVDDYMGNGGEWGAKGARLGYKVTSTPKAGYLVSFLPGVAGSSSQYGHVAFVEAVTKDGILISEGNVVGGTRVSYRIISNDIARSSQVNYIVAKQK
ncbi:glucosaminidase domain-containing protein [Vagococcus zengguangii]|uniref:glucosaminidase domain-containing protein n=1 Tax=Vagococcus zengguangii TaxID=2571750 RepID=UPI001FE7DFB2|nr:glucosaminidase domain-containing protein [Vagococcus zengguangii]